jgi:hypothetical protein
VLHDSDWTLGTKKKQDGTYVKSPSWTQNFNIYELVHEARLRGIGVSHQVSIPDFERRIGLPRGTGGKPFEAYEAIRAKADIKAEVQALLKSLMKIEKYDTTRDIPPLDVESFEESLRVSLRAQVKDNDDDDGYRLGE